MVIYSFLKSFGPAQVVYIQHCLPYFCSQDERRKKIVEMGGAQELLNMLSTAKDDRTRKEALHALDALSQSGEIIILSIFIYVLFYKHCHFSFLSRLFLK